MTNNDDAEYSVLCSITNVLASLNSYTMDLFHLKEDNTAKLDRLRAQVKDLNPAATTFIECPRYQYKVSVDETANNINSVIEQVMTLLSSISLQTQEIQTLRSFLVSQGIPPLG